MAEGMILIIDDDIPFAETMRRTLSMDGYVSVVVHCGQDALKALEVDPKAFDLALLDMRLPDTDGLALLPKILGLRADLPVIVMTAFGTIQTAVEAMRAGAFDFLLKPFPRELLLGTMERAFERFRLVRENRLLRSQLQSELSRNAVRTVSPVFARVLDMARHVAPTDATVLLTGETGTGKEGVAHLVYELSNRAAGPFVRINCAALAESLLEAQLFGFTKGAFTGADESRKGLFEEASGGTLFLDEIGDISPALQTKFLRVLQEGEFLPVGDTVPRHTDVRIIAATNRNLRAAVAQGHFRDDLYYRLNVFSLHLPPLRERMEDLPQLVQTFVDEANCRAGKKVRGLTVEATDRCNAYHWPGNVRELRNVVERAIILCQGEWLGAEALGLSSSGETAAAQPVHRSWEGRPLWEVERDHIRETLGHTRWAKSAAARTLGISRKTLDRKIREFDLAQEVAP